MPLTLQYCSDLHLEFDLNRKWIAKYPLQVKADILLLGGDIIPFAQMGQHDYFFDFVAQKYKAAYWIPGNHEYYHADIAHRSGTMNEAIRDNVFLVNNTTIPLGDTDLICSTLWSHIQPHNQWQITRAMSDFHVIENDGHRLNISDYNRLHTLCRKYIEEAVVASTATHKVVLTHHVPTLMNYPEKYKGDVLNEAFATELYNFIETAGIDAWIYGHTHTNITDFTIHNTRLLSNQLGYVKYGEHTTFARDKVITV